MANIFDYYDPNGMMQSYNTAPSEILARIQAGGQMLTNPYVTNVTGGGSTPSPVSAVPQAPLFTPVPQQDPVTPPPAPVDPSVFANELDVFGGGGGFNDGFGGGVDIGRIDIGGGVNVTSLPGGGAVEGSPLDVLNKIASGELTPEQAKEQYPEAYAVLYGDYEQQLEENQTDPETDVAVTPPPLLTGDTQEEKGSWTDSLPSLEDLMGKIRQAAKDAVPSTAEEWGDLIRDILKAEGVNLPSGNIDDILAGGYGVRWDDFSQILKDIQQGTVFVPGLPGGVSPGSVDIGTIEEILKQPESGNWEDWKVWEKIKQTAKNPTTILSGVFSNTDEIPGWLKTAILAGDYGEDALDWLKGISGGSEEEEETVIPVTETEEEVDITQDDTTEDLQEDGKLVFGHEGGKPVTETETIEEIITGTASEDIDTSDQSKLTFGGEGEREEEIIINGDPNEEEQEEELTTGSSGGGGGGSSVSSVGDFKPFMSGISYETPAISELIQSPNVDYNAQLNAIINRNVGLFEGMV